MTRRTQQYEVANLVPLTLRQVGGPVSPPDVGGRIRGLQFVPNMGNLKVDDPVAVPINNEWSGAVGPIARSRPCGEEESSVLTSANRHLAHYSIVVVMSVEAALSFD